MVSFGGSSVSCGNHANEAKGEPPAFYSYTDPEPGALCTIGQGCIFWENPSAIPAGTTLAGVGHSHPFGGTYSYEDTNVADTLGVPSFLGTPQGCVWMYPPNSIPPATLLQGGAGCH